MCLFAVLSPSTCHLAFLTACLIDNRPMSLYLPVSHFGGTQIYTPWFLLKGVVTGDRGGECGGLGGSVRGCRGCVSGWGGVVGQVEAKELEEGVVRSGGNRCRFILFPSYLHSPPSLPLYLLPPGSSITCLTLLHLLTSPASLVSPAPTCHARGSRVCGSCSVLRSHVLWVLNFL